MPILRHATTTDRAARIRTEGLRVECALGKEKALWLHTASKTHWAIAHTQKRHNVPLEDIVIFEVSIPRTHLRRAWTGLWKTFSDVVPARMKEIGTGLTFAASPLEE